MTERFESPLHLRNACSAGTFSGQTSGQCQGYAQANLVILPKQYAFDFLLFCQRNPKPCPLLEVLEAGHPNVTLAGDADVRNALPKYRIFIDGVLTEEVTDITSYFTDDLVTFVIGCSFSFEEAMLRCSIPVRHIEEKCNVPMYRTSMPCHPAGSFSGDLVVSMRPMSSRDAIRAVQVTSQYPRVHGAPIHIGDPSVIGIGDISKPDFGDPVTIAEGEVPVFWACGVTPQAVVMKSKPSLCITHAPGHMLVLDVKNEELSLG